MSIFIWFGFLSNLDYELCVYSLNEELSQDKCSFDLQSFEEVLDKNSPTQIPRPCQDLLDFAASKNGEMRFA